MEARLRAAEEPVAAVGEPAQPQLASNPVGGDPLGVAEEAGAGGERDRPHRADAVDLQPGRVSTIRPGAASTAACAAPGANTRSRISFPAGEIVSTLPLASTAA